jgi:hypothetical protein
MMTRRSCALLASALVMAACGGVTIGLPDEIGADFDLEATLDDLRDCDTLGDTFVAVVRQAAADIDAMAEASGGRVPAGDLADRIDVLSAGAYWEVARRLGCDAVAQRVDTIDRLRQLDPTSPAGSELVTEVIRRMEEESG